MFYHHVWTIKKKTTLELYDLEITTIILGVNILLITKREINVYSLK